ncbi:hypothetical protein SAMD00023353_0902090 [Rosellinia necatrix]|uniref:Uncharacterized protein n=1 Tax=Rosellinia necatrix TaxID=77044 RepID=A0A1W2TLF1_ROSNE|nr:hypothetical protein SAMD00023353_0902090 [Rosellinia necatrix]
MKPAALLMAPLAAALAVPPRGVAVSSSSSSSSKRHDPMVLFVPFVPFTPEQGGFDACATETHHLSMLGHPASMMDCLELSAWAAENNGVWIVGADDDGDGGDNDGGWRALQTRGACALYARSARPTPVGNWDVVDLIEAIHLGDGIRLGSVEEVGVLGACQGGDNVSFWLRNPGL